MLTVTESPVDLDHAKVLTESEHAVLVDALRSVVDQSDVDEYLTADVTGEIVHRMRHNAAADLLEALEHRTVVIADLVVDLGS